MAEKVYIITLHDASWANTGDFIVGVFTDEDKAQEQADWLEQNLSLLSGDSVYVEEHNITQEVDKRGAGSTICSYLYSSLYDDED